MAGTKLNNFKKSIPTHRLAYNQKYIRVSRSLVMINETTEFDAAWTSIWLSESLRTVGFFKLYARIRNRCRRWGSSKIMMGLNRREGSRN